MGCIPGFLLMFGVAIGVFLLLNPVMPWGLAALIAASLLFGWYKLNQYSALRGSSRTILGAYFKARVGGRSHAESLKHAVVTRYFSEAKREELLTRYTSVVRGIESEAEQVRTLVRVLHWEEVGMPPPAAWQVGVEHERNLNEELARAESKYGITLNRSGPAQDGSLKPEATQTKPARSDGGALIITCTECGQRMRVPRGKGRIRIRCSACGAQREYTS